MKSRESGQNYLEGWALDYNLFRPHMGLKGRTPAQAAGMAVPFKNWKDVAETVMPVTTSTRPDWQTQDEHTNASKDFQVMDVATAREATEPLKRKRPSGQGFRVRKGIKWSVPYLAIEPLTPHRMRIISGQSYALTNFAQICKLNPRGQGVM